MKLNYSEGTWFAVPLLDGGFGVGVVARTTSKGRVILVYLFGPRRENVPPLTEMAELNPGAAVLTVRIGDLNLFNGTWPILGKLSRWQRGEWPIPLFVRSSELSRRAYIVRYDDKDPGRAVSEEQVEYGVCTLERDCVMGAGSVEIALTKLLAPDQASRPATDSIQVKGGDMHAWQASIFTGDDAAGWLGELVDPEQVREALAAVVKAPKDEYLEVDTCGAALAAAEIVAACCGRPAKHLPENAVEWVSAHPGLGKKHLASLAEKAVRRVEARSEMQAQFDESELKEQWHGVVKDLLSRLSSADP